MNSTNNRTWPSAWPYLLLAMTVIVSSPQIQSQPALMQSQAGAAMQIAKNDTATINVDGRLNEPVWQTLMASDSMQVVDPDTLQTASQPTLTRVFYTDRGLYIGIDAIQPPNTLLARLSSRDADINRDGVIVYLDTSGEGRYGYYFGVNLGGTLLDGTLLPERQMSSLWDGPWLGAVQENERGYQVEMFLPWSMMNMPSTDAETRQLAVAVTRRTAALDETWGWPALPESQARFMSGMQPLVLDGLSNRNLSQGLTLYPSAAFTHDRMRMDNSSRIGSDIYWRPNNAMQLSATLLPDFGVVESDDVIVNLTAFETFYPEKRPFFLEGNEIFITSPRAAVRAAASSTGARAVPNSFSLEPTTLLNTRRIGGAPERPVIPAGVRVADQQLSNPSELYGAGKLTGQQGRLRYGVMFASEEDSTLYGRDTALNEIPVEQSGRDFGIMRVLYEDTSIGRRALGFMSTAVSHTQSDAYTNGVDLHYVTANRRVIADVQLMHSDVNNQSGAGGYFDVSYVPRQGISHRLSMDYLDRTLDISDLGYLRRNDLASFRYTFNQQSSASQRFRFVNHNITISQETNTNGRLVNSSFYYRNTLTRQNRHQINTTAILRPERWDDRTSLGNGSFRYARGGQLELTYGTDTSRVLSSSIGINTSTEALGDWSYQAKGGITYKPNDRLSMDLDLIVRKANNWLVNLNGTTLATYDALQWQPSIKADLFFTARQQLQFSLQWVGIEGDTTNLYRVPGGYGELQPLNPAAAAASRYDLRISRLSAQIRYRWEIAPLSDLFVVYTRGANVPAGTADGFSDLFHEALIRPVIDRLVIKLRYRFGV